MRLTATVRGTELSERNRGPFRATKDAGPVVLASHRVMRVPHLGDAHRPPQVVDVPVTAHGTAHMARDSRPDPTRTKRTADVDVKPLTHGQKTKPAHGNLIPAGTPTHERIRPRMRCERSYGRPLPCH